jgi:hypothetical protein
VPAGHLVGDLMPVHLARDGRVDMAGRVGDFLDADGMVAQH